MMYEIFFFIVMIVYAICLLVCLFFTFKFILLLIDITRDNEFPDSMDFYMPSSRKNIQSKSPVEIKGYLRE